MSLGHGSSIVRSGLVLHLDAANRKSYPGSGTIWGDLSGNGNNGTLVNGVGYSSDNNGSLVFDGVDDQIPNPVPLSALGNTTPITTTASFWFKAAATSGRRNISWAFADGMIIASVNNNLYFYRGNSYISTNVVIFDNTWKNLARVDNGNGNSLLFYLNGNLVHTDQSFITYGASQHNFFTSYGNGALGGYFPGNASVIQIYNRALTAQEIQQNFNALRGRYGV